MALTSRFPLRAACAVGAAGIALVLFAGVALHASLPATLGDGAVSDVPDAWLQLVAAGARDVWASAVNSQVTARPECDRPAEMPVPRLSDASLCVDGRVMPGLLLLGCMKCATSSLHAALRNVSGGRVVEGGCPPGADCAGFRSYRLKEKHFFDNNRTYHQGLRAYRAIYPPCPSPDEGGGGFVVGIDSSPSYIRDPWSPIRVASAYGGCGGSSSLMARLVLVVVLRDPTDRAISQFAHLHSAEASRPGSFEEWAAMQLRLAVAYLAGAGTDGFEVSADAARTA